MGNELKKTGLECRPARLLLVPILLASAYAAVGGNIQGVFSLFPIIRDEFGLSRAQAGLYSSFHFLSATVLAVFSGRFIDVVGARKGLICGVSGVGLVMIAISFAPGYRFILALAFVCGIVFSMITPSVSRGIIENTHPRRRAFHMGIAHSGGGTGGMVAAVLLPLIATALGWRVAILVSGSFALVIAVVIGRFYPRISTDKSSSEPDGAAGEDEGFRAGVKDLLSNRFFLSVCFLGIALGAAMSSVVAHFTIFLNTDFLLSPVRSGIGLAALQVGGVTGMSGWGIVSDRLFSGRRHRALCFVTACISAISLLMVFLTGRPAINYVMIILLAFVTGFICLGTMALFFTTITEAAGEGRAGLGTGMALIFSRTGVILGPPLFGRIADIADTYRYSWLALGVLAVFFSAAFALARKFK